MSATAPTPRDISDDLRAMRRNAGRHMPTRDGLIRWSIVLDDVMIGRLTDAAALIEWQAAEIERLRNELDSRMQQASDRVDDALAAGCTRSCLT